MPNHVEIRAALVGDVPLILEFIHAIAAYEKMSDEVHTNEAILRESLFGERPAAEVLLAFHQGEPAGYAVTFSTFSTFEGRAGLWLEDLFVHEAFRGKGIGKALFEAVRLRASERGCPRLEWVALDWNQSAIDFYEAHGARALKGWIQFRMDPRNPQDSSN